eukprot:4818591-Prymnesium_polylepis.1
MKQKLVCAKRACHDRTLPGVAMGLVGPKVLLVLLLFAAGLAYAEKKHRRHARDEGKYDTVARGAVGAAVGAGAAAAAPTVVGAALGIGAAGPVAGGAFAAAQAAAAGGVAGGGLAAGGILPAAQALVMGGVGAPVMVPAAIIGGLAYALFG